MKSFITLTLTIISCMTQLINAAILRNKTSIKVTDTLSALKNSAATYAKIILEYDGKQAKSNEQDTAEQAIVKEIKKIKVNDSEPDLGKRNALNSLHYFFSRLARLVPEINEGNNSNILYENFKNFVKNLVLDFLGETEPKNKVILLTDILESIAKNFNDELAKERFTKKTDVLLPADKLSILPKILLSSASIIVNRISKHYIENPIKVVRTAQGKICPRPIMHFIELVKSYQNVNLIKFDAEGFKEVSDACYKTTKDLTDFFKAFKSEDDNPRRELNDPMYFTNVRSKLFENKQYTKENYGDFYVEVK